MDGFIFHKQLQNELQFLINNSHKLDGVLCFYGRPGCGKTTFSKFFCNQVAKETIYLDACSHIFDKTSAGNILKTIQDSRATLSAFLNEDYNAKAYWNKAIIIDEFHNLSPSRQDAFKITLEQMTKEFNYLFILIVNTSKDKPLAKTLTPAILSRVQTVCFDIQKSQYEEVTAIIKERCPVLSESFIEQTLPDLRQIFKKVRLLSD
jgi:replication-associated recombination protein RarA